MHQQTVEKCQINVCVRFKPLGFRDRNAVKLRRQSDSSCQGTVLVGEKYFAFDSVFEADASQEKVYQTCIKPLVDGFFQGYNATVFACE